MKDLLGLAGSVAQWVGGQSFTDAVREEAVAIQRRSVALVALRHKLLSSARGEAIEGSVCASNAWHAVSAMRTARPVPAAAAVER